MQNLRLPYTLTVLFCAAALCGAGCHRANNSGHDSLADAVREAAAPVPKSATAHPATPSALPPQGNELRPEARSVAVGSAPPADTAGAASPGDPQQELETWERQLAERQAALDARERKLAERERMAPGNRPAPAPAPAAPLASAPAAVASAPPPPATVPPAARIGESRRLREPRAVAGTVPAGARLSIALTRSLTSRGSRVGERVYARVASPVYAHGVVVVPRGAEVIGVVTQAGAPRRLGGRATLGVRFTSLVLPSGARVPIQGSFVAHGRNRSRRSAAIVGGSAAGGAILGHNIHRGNRGTLIGALLGAAAGSAVAANVPGPDVVIPRGTVVRVKLRRAVRI